MKAESRKSIETHILASFSTYVSRRSKRLADWTSCRLDLGHPSRRSWTWKACLLNLASSADRLSRLEPRRHRSKCSKTHTWASHDTEARRHISSTGQAMLMVDNARHSKNYLVPLGDKNACLKAMVSGVRLSDLEVNESYIDLEISFTSSC